MRRHPRRGGFTLIELLLVLVILGTLAAIVVPQLAGEGKAAKITATHATVRNIENALDRYEQHNDAYPATEMGLEALVNAPTDKPNWKGPYLKTATVPKDAWNNPFSFRCPGEKNPKTFDLWSTGPDGQQGGGDDIGNWTEEAAK